MSHSHATVHHRPTPAPRRVRLLVTALVAPLVLATVVGLLVLWPGDGPGPSQEYAVERAHGTVVDVGPCAEPAPNCLVATVDVTRGPGEGRRVEAAAPSGVQAPELVAGDRVLLSYLEDGPTGETWSFQDFDRGRPLTLLLAAFVLGVLLLSRWRGVGSLLSLGLSLVLLTSFTLPSLAEGTSPLLVAVVTAGAIMITTLWLSHGVSVRTGVAMVGTLAALVLTGVLGAVVTAAGRFTGLSGEGNQYLAAINGEVQVGGLLLAGLVIGALGVLDDVTVTQAAVVWELAEADPAASRATLLARGMRVGRAHVASTVNTLALAYVGASLPLLLVVSALELPLTTVVSQELIAQELVRGLVGSLGIIAAVPITTGLAALVATYARPDRVQTEPPGDPARTRSSDPAEPGRRSAGRAPGAG